MPGATTWTEIYTTYFGPTGTANCSRNGGCHTNTKKGFKCGNDKTTCYNGLKTKGLISPGPNAGSSVLGDPNTSPLCGTLGGNMPPQGSGTCLNSAAVQKLDSWLKNGAQND
jgi:hypothetical protein